MADQPENGSIGREQVELLRSIWNEIKGLNGRIDQTNVRLDQTNVRLDAVRTELKAEIAAVRTELKSENDALRRRMTESEIRVASAVTELAEETRGLSSLIRDWREEHRADRQDIKNRLDRIERQVGLTPP